MADKPVRLYHRSPEGEGVSPRTFGLDFLQTPPHDDASRVKLGIFDLPFLLASGELLAIGSTNTWHEDFHLVSYVPCPARSPSGAA